MLLRENMKGYRITPAFVLGRGREGAFSSVADAAVREVAMEGILFVAKFLSFFLSFMLHLPFHSCSKGVDPLAALRNDTPTSYGENLSLYLSIYLSPHDLRLFQARIKQVYVAWRQQRTSRTPSATLGCLLYHTPPTPLPTFVMGTYYYYHTMMRYNKLPQMKPNSLITTKQNFFNARAAYNSHLPSLPSSHHSFQPSGRWYE